jgi:hypothetical protein
MHTFVVDDRNHPQISEIHAQLKRLSGWIHEEGYLTKVEFVLHNVEEEVEKVSSFCHHSEKLANALNGLISTHTYLLVLHILKNWILEYVGTIIHPQSSLVGGWE